MAHVDDEIAQLASEDGYYVVARTDRLVELEQKNSWLTVIVTGVLSGRSPGLSRTNRIDELGEAKMRLSRPVPDR